MKSSIARFFPPFMYFGPANLITTLVISSAVLGTVLFAGGRSNAGFILLIVAVGMDRVDGMVARTMNDHTPLGEQLDSLADALTFCFLPAFAAYSLGFSTWYEDIVLVFFVASGLWRLAYFNISGLNEVDSRQYFTGVPTTICASWFAVLSPLWVAQYSTSLVTTLFFVFFIVSALAMVSSVPYNKNGIWTKLLYILLPLAVVYLWVR